MRAFLSRVAIGRLAFMLTFGALGACADQPITSPATPPAVPSAAGADVVPTADANSTSVTFTFARSGNYFYESTGAVGVNGTFTCSRALGEEFTLLVKVEQRLPAKGLASGFMMQKLTCGTTAAQPWVAAVPQGGGGFYAGQALVTASTYLVPPDMVPTLASAKVKLALSEAF